MNERTKQLWFPALVSVTLANLLLFALTHASLDPRRMASRSTSLHPGLALAFELLPWLVAQPLIGAAAAYISRRAGGKRSSRIIAALFPALVMLALWCVVVPIGAVAQQNVFVLSHPGLFILGAIPFAVVPGTALLLGALPLLKTSEVPRTS
jgi:hypothetical protein